MEDSISFMIGDSIKSGYQGYADTNNWSQNGTHTHEQEDSISLGYQEYADLFSTSNWSQNGTHNPLTQEQYADIYAYCSSADLSVLFNKDNPSTDEEFAYLIGKWKDCVSNSGIVSKDYMPDSGIVNKNNMSDTITLKEKLEF